MKRDDRPMDEDQEAANCSQRMEIHYRDDAEITVDGAIDLYRRSTLGERRPIDRPDVFAGMLKNADLLISAWHGPLLVGIARTLSDFSCLPPFTADACRSPCHCARFSGA